MLQHSHRIFPLLFLLFGPGICHAQNATPLKRPDSLRGDYHSEHLSILVGYNGWHYSYFELGFAKNIKGQAGHHPFATAVYISSEGIIRNNTFIMAPKVGGWVAGGAAPVAMGVATIYYTDFNGGTLRLRPEAGFGIGVCKLTWGYNMAITNRHFIGVNRHVISLQVAISVKKQWQ